MTFRLQAKTFLLTYAQCDLEKEVLLSFLKSLAPLKEWCIGKERHADGGKHLHAWVYYKDKIRTRDERYFDCHGFHPNILVAKSKKGSIAYCSKEDPEPLTHLEGKQSYGDIFDQATTRDEFMEMVLTSHPRDYAHNYDRLDSMARQHFKPKKVKYTPRYTNFTNVPLEMSAIEIVTNIDRPKTLVILGNRGIGKTEWARSHGNHIYARGCVIYDDIMGELEDAKYAVFDDLWDWNFRFLKDFLGGQPTATITGKYRKPKQVPWGLRSIFLTNEEFWLQWTPKQHEYFQQSTIIINLTNKLY